MPDPSDQELLRRYAIQGAEAAFAELVDRHCNLVWAAARRITGDGEAARDVAQTVFTDLARKAGSLPAGTILAGWLYRAARLTASKHVRSEARRRQRELEAMNDEAHFSANPARSQAAEELQLLLDAALAELSEGDRNAVVLRFLCGHSFAQVGQALGSNEDAAQKRVSRALERLRTTFQRRQVVANGGVVASALGLAGAQVAPAGLAASLSHNALAATGTAAGGSLLTLMKSKLAVTLVSGAIVATVIGYQHQAGRLLRAENADLRQQVVALTEATNRPASAFSLSEELARSRNDHAELLRLRGEVARFRQDRADRGRSAQDREEVATSLADPGASVSQREFTAQSALINIASREIGLGVGRYCDEHEDQLPATFDDIGAYAALKSDGGFLGGISFGDFEFFPHPRPISRAESKLILVREKVSRRIPMDLPQHPDPIMRRSGWERSYLLVDGTALLVNFENNDFSPFERQYTATEAEAPDASPVAAGGR